MDSVENSCDLSEPPDDDPEVQEIDPTGRYIRYREVLGKGAFKTVYKAFDEIDGIEVAWNQINTEDVVRSPQDLQRLYSEVHLLKSLKHKNIIKFYNSWMDESKKTLNIITELFTSGSLRHYIKKHKKIDIKAVKGWARQVLTGLDYLHSHNPPIMHRDLKCDNIFINGNHGEVKIGDLGFATIMEQANLHSAIGTPEFMSPELYDEDYNQLADIYSFGMCLLEMVTCEYPYSECRNAAHIYKKVSSGIKPASLSKVKNPEVKLLIEKCLVPAAQRVSAKELLQDPFLQVDGVAGHLSRGGLGVVSPSPNVEALKILPEECIKTRQMCSMDVDANESSKPPVITIEYSVDGSNMLRLEVQLAHESNIVFKLQGEKIDESTAFMILWIAEQKSRVRKIEFQVFLDSDTSLSVARDMIDQLELAHQYVMFIAELIDLSLTNLIPRWKLSVPIKHLEVLNGIQTLESPAAGKNSQIAEERGTISVVSFHDLFEGVSLSNVSSSLGSSFVEGLHHMKSDDSDHVILDKSMYQGDFGSHNTAMTEHRVSDMSMISDTTNYGNYKACSIDRCMSADSVGLNMSSSDMPTFLNSPSNASSITTEHGDNEELRTHLEQIELQFQQAMKEITLKRNEAIMAAKKRLSRR